MKASKKRGSKKSTEIKDEIFSGSMRNAQYEPSDSEDEYSQQEKMLLDKVRSRSTRSKPQKKLAVMDLPLYEDDDDDDDPQQGGGGDEDDDDDDDVNMDSDIEGKDDDFNLPDQRAWGKTKRNYYNTDYVDQDYGGFDGEDAEAAELEEQEAREIQKRLAAELDDNDFTLDVFTKSKEDEQSTTKTSQEVIKTDLSQLSSRQKLALLQKEAPELAGIISEFRGMMEELENRLQPAVTLVQGKQVSSPQLVQYIHTKYHLVNNYILNMGFYLLLRARRLPITAHPVVKRLLQYRQLLQQLEPLELIATGQLQDLLEAAKKGSLPQENGVTFKKQTKNPLRLLSLSTSKKVEEDENISDGFETEINKRDKLTDKQKLKVKTSKSSSKNSKKGEQEMPWGNTLDNQDKKDVPWATSGSDGESGGEDMDESGALDDLQEDEDTKRAITWQMAKNKGLTPRRKKEQRNPRVKHRNKFRKAKIRRKGQVREPRTELQRYGGEISGIKKTVSKSIKIK